METLSHFVWWIVGAIVPLAILLYWKFALDFHWFDFWYNFPVFGKFTKLEKNTGCEDGSDWSDSENELCRDYGKFIHYPDQAEFKNNLLYLHKAEDGGRKPIPKLMWAFLIMLVVAEGLGFSYLLGTFMAHEGSENTQTMLMWAIVFVLSGILMWVTHASGEELYKTNLIRYHIKNRGTQRGKGAPEITSFMLEKDQSEDDDKSRSVQCLSRVDDRPGNYPWTIVAGVMIVAIAIGSTWVRVYHMENMLASETTGNTVTVNPANPFSTPSELSGPQIQAEQKAAQELKHGQTSEAFGAFSMLAFIFVVTQIVGIGTGYKHKFAGRYSKGAYDGTRGFASYQQVREYYKPRIQVAEARLKTLQTKLASEQSSHHLSLTKRFADFLYESQKTEGNENNGNSTPDKLTTVLNDASITPKQQPKETSSSTINLDQAKAHIADLTDNQAQRDYFTNLPASIQEEITPWLLMRVEEAAAAATKKQHDLNALFGKQS